MIWALKKLLTYYPDLYTPLFFHWFCFHLQMLCLQLTTKYNGCILPSHPALQMETHWRCCHYHNLWNSIDRKKEKMLPLKNIYLLISLSSYPFSHHHHQQIWFTLVLRRHKPMLWLLMSTEFFWNTWLYVYCYSL